MNQNLVIQSDLFGMVIRDPFKGLSDLQRSGIPPFPVMPKQLHGVTFNRSIIIHHMVHIALGRFQRRKTSNVHLGIGGMFQGFQWDFP